MAIVVNPQDMYLSPEGKVKISDHNLSNGLFKNQKETMEAIKKFASSADMSDISFDEDGSVLINNKEMAEKVKDAINNPVSGVAAGQSICGAGCAGL
ncbi:hypothetical protein [Caenispirillum salinarum]|uniref:hypothetical protein n=1 Tax=Caenispirillum salinarum TaxID=859058 RepID=UPI0012672469|nr:hypothetical protein [Caenispirillum salinarum]